MPTAPIPRPKLWGCCMASEEEDLYPSRCGERGRILPRQDPVVYEPRAIGPLHPPQLLQYSQAGYLQCEGLFDEAEVARLEGAVAGLCASERMRERPETVREPNGDAVRSIFRPDLFSEPIAELVRDRRLVAMAEQILGSTVYVHQSRINFKPAFSGKEFFWHSDFETWHVEDGLPRMRALSIAVSLTDNTEFNGPLMVIPGSHRQFVACGGTTPENHYRESLRRQHYGTPDHDLLAALAREYGIDAPKGPAGSIVLFDCNLMHGSGANISPFPRCNVFIVYNSTSNAPRAPYSGQAPRPSYIASRDVVPLTA